MKKHNHMQRSTYLKINNTLAVLAFVKIHVTLAIMLLCAPGLWAQQVSFSASGLKGESTTNPTSIQFGPDGRLYVAQQNGLIYAYQIVRNGPSNYEVFGTEEINLIQNIPNHQDNGPLSAVGNRQVTGILVTGSPEHPKLFVSSSDPRIGAGGGGNDKNLDTNSGIVSCLECTGGINQNGQCEQWTKTDLVRGLPRSEENHSVNGMQYDVSQNILYLAVGGHTNAGAPSNNFAYTVEYTFSSVIVSIDLDAIDALPLQWDNGAAYKYDLPTLDDPTRDNANGINDPNAPGYDGMDINDPFGGNDGLNMAKFDPEGPVQIHAFGFRNLYDLLLTKDGKMYGVDNGANSGWGGHPDGEADYPSEMPTLNGQVVSQATNAFLPGEPGSTGSGPGGDDVVNNENGLHYIRQLEPGDFNYVQPEKYYGGHPHPIWANPAGAGLYTKGEHTLHPNDSTDAYWRHEILPIDDPNFATQSLPVDWPPVPTDYAFPAAGDFQNSGQDDSALANFGPSTNGIAEYTASNFNDALKGHLLLAAFNGKIYQVALSSDGKVALNCPTPPRDGKTEVEDCDEATFASGFGSTPLDIIAQGDDDPFGGTVWAATYGSDDITIFEPTDYNGNTPIVCGGEYDDTLDEDGDFYTNADELDNGTNPCSGASKPKDSDNAFEFGENHSFKRSDLNDQDDDNDGLADVLDPFQLDPLNGKGQSGRLPIRLELFNATGYGFGDIGFTGIMVNGINDYFDLIDDDGDELVFGGTAGIYTDPSVTNGTPLEGSNSQRNGFQFAVDVDTMTGPFTVESQINAPYLGFPDQTNLAAHGIYLGTGDQDNFVQFVLSGAQNGFQVIVENDGISSTSSFFGDHLFSAMAIQLYLSVDPAAGTVQAKYALDGGDIFTLGSPIPLTGKLLQVIQGKYLINNQPSCLAVGTIAQSSGNSDAFAASWDYFHVTQDPSTAQSLVAVNTSELDGSTYANSSFQITNQSTNREFITKVTIDLSSAIIPEVVFDPTGDAGDAAFKDLTASLQSDETTGLVQHTFNAFHEGGFYELEMHFNDFAPGEKLQFGIDIDPVSIKGGSPPGPNKSGSVSGLELTGSVVTITYDNGETQTVDLFRTIASNSQSTNISRRQLPPQPALSILGVTNQSTLTDAAQTVQVHVGFEEVDVRLLHLEAGLFVQDLDGPFAGIGYRIDPFEINSIVQVYEQKGVTTTDGNVYFNVNLTNSDPEAGYNIFAAVVEDADGATSKVSNYFIVKYDPDAELTTLYRLNSASETLAATDAGPNWTGVGSDGPQSGPGWDVNTGIVSVENITSLHPSVPNYVPESLFDKARYDANDAPEMAWSFDVPNGLYALRLYLGNGFSGTSQIGERTFDIILEGQPALNNFDCIETFGFQVGGMVELTTWVADGTLNLQLLRQNNNPIIHGIEVLGYTVDLNPIIVSEITNQNNEEGNDISGLFISAYGGDGNLVFEASNLPPGVSLEPTNGQFTGSIAQDAHLNSPYFVTVMVGDSDQDPDDTKILTFIWEIFEPTPVPGQIYYRVNAGGPALVATDLGHPDWNQDEGDFGDPENSDYLAALETSKSTYDQSSNSAYKNPVIRNISIPDYVPDDLFTTERYDPEGEPDMLYAFPILQGTTVDIDLYFAELFKNVTEANDRYFDVVIEGDTVFKKVDPFALAGPVGAVRLSHRTVVEEDGKLDISFARGSQNPALKGIQVKIANLSAPEISVPDDVTFSVLSEFGAGRFPLMANDPENDPVTFTASGLPEGLSIQNNEIVGTISSNALTGGPNEDGVHWVKLYASDDQQNTSEAYFTFNVTDRSIIITNPSTQEMVPSTGFTVAWNTKGGATDVFEHVHVILVGGEYTDDGFTRLGSMPLAGVATFPNATYPQLLPGAYEVIIKWAYPNHQEMDEEFAKPASIPITIGDIPYSQPTIADMLNIGANQTNLCGTTYQLGDKNLLPLNGSYSGIWSFDQNPGGSGALNSATVPFPELTGLFGETYILRWTITETATGAMHSETVSIHFAPDADLPGGLPDGVQDCVDECLGYDDFKNSDGLGAPDGCDCNPDNADSEFVLLSSIPPTNLVEADYELSVNLEIDPSESSDLLTLRAGYSIKFLPGFHAKPGVNIKAYIDNCASEAVAAAMASPVADLNDHIPLDKRKPPTVIPALTVIPNIATTQTMVSLQLSEPQEVTLYLLNQNGQMVKFLLNQVNLDAGQHDYRLSLSNIPPGMYYLRWVSQANPLTEPLIVAPH